MTAFAQLKGLRATVVGAAREGTALSRFLAGVGARVMLVDSKPKEALSDEVIALEQLGVELCTNGFEPDLSDTDVVFLSPGVPPTAGIVGRARALGIPLSSEPRLFMQLCGVPVVGITGSSGKTTTTALTGLMLQKSGLSAWVGGNIGTPLIGRLLSVERPDLSVLELSSFQLELFSPDYQAKANHSVQRQSGSVNTEGTSPHVAVVTNITPNHLDRHPSMEDYAKAKSNILRYQTDQDWVVLNADDSWTPKLETLTPARRLYFSLEHQVMQGGWLEGENLMLRFGDDLVELARVEQVRLRGRHNLANVLTAACAAMAAGASIDGVRGAIRGFQGVPHRLEFVREMDGITFINDSIATSPERATAALWSFERPVFLLAGGRDKHLPWGAWADAVEQRARLVVAFGEIVPIVKKALSASTVKVISVETLGDAVREARNRAASGDIVLLSPGGTSFDAYRDFEERGHEFRMLVGELEARG